MNGKILIVDDERAIRNAVRDTFSREGYYAVTAPDGEEALRRCRAEAFDLLITDMKMPGISGLELIRAVRTLLPEIRTVIMTAYGSAESAIEALRLEVSDYMMKPFRLADMRCTVNRLLHDIQVAVCEAEAASAAPKRFEFKFDLDGSESFVVNGMVETTDSSKAEASAEAVRAAARILCLQAKQRGAKIEPADAAELVSDVLYFEKRAPVRLVCSRVSPAHCLRACIGTDGSSFESFDSDAQSRMPAAGSFPNLKAIIMQTHFPEAECLSTTGITGDNHFQFAADSSRNTTTISLDSDHADLKNLVEELGRAARSWGMDLERTNEMITAVNEAVLNAIEHGYGSDRSGKVEIVCSLVNDELVAIVKDYGNGFDTASVSEGGGFTKLKLHADRVAVESSPGAGTAVYLAKSLR